MSIAQTLKITSVGIDMCEFTTLVHIPCARPALLFSRPTADVCFCDTTPCLLECAEKYLYGPLGEPSLPWKT